MPEPTEVMITTPFYQQQQNEISRFLKIKPLALGILEILIALLKLGLTIWNKSFFVIWSPFIYIVIGAITVSAAHTCKPRLVKSSQMLSYVNVAVVSFSLRAHFILVGVTSDVSSYVPVICDILIFIFSLAVAVTACSCCCRPKSTPVIISYETTDLPVNHIMQMGQPDSSAVAQPVSSAMYMLPATHGSVPPVPLPNYSHVPSASPPMYSAVPTTPPSSYDKVSDALPPNYSPVPSTPLPAYEHEDFQTRR